VTKFKNVSIRSKFLLGVIFTVLAALFVALASIATISHTLATNEFREQLNVLVNITAERSQAALAFQDSRTVTQNLHTLSKLKSIDLACMYTIDRKVFAQYLRFEEAKCPDQSTLQKAENDSKSFFSVTKNLEVKGREIGFLYVEANSQRLNQRLIQFMAYAGIIVLFSSFIAYLIALRLQFLLIMPIIKLSNLAKEIGRTKDFSLRAKIFNDDEAGYLAKSFNGLVHDVQESNMQMEDMVLELQEKTQQLEAHTELVESRNKTIKNMFTGASHDLNQPLQAMVLFVNALNRLCDEPQKVMLSKLESAIQNMKSLLRDLLDVSKLENRLDNVDTAPVKLKPMLDNVFHEFEAIAADKSIKLKFHAKDFVINSDIGMLERIVRNLLSNAIRYTSQGGVLLACRKRKGQVSIEIWDTGRGIPKDSMDSIFKRFYQVEEKTEEGQQGYGIGLSIVKRLSERLKHRIEVKSTVGQGTLFRILVPIIDSLENTQIHRSNKIATHGSDDTTSTLTLAPVSSNIDKVFDQRSDKTAHPSNDKTIMLPGSGTQVLLIDDDDLVRDAIFELITGWGMQVTPFASIAQMSQYFNDNPNYKCDVIVSDFQLSETENGLDAIAVVRRSQGVDKPALIVSGTDDAELIKVIKDSGIRRLKKPVKPAKLRALINHLYVNKIDGN
jgi:signal transduction histidine kinase